jgi:hypothetical protein
MEVFGYTNMDNSAHKIWFKSCKKSFSQLQQHQQHHLSARYGKSNQILEIGKDGGGRPKAAFAT